MCGISNATLKQQKKRFPVSLPTRRISFIYLKAFPFSAMMILWSFWQIVLLVVCCFWRRNRRPEAGGGGEDKHESNLDTRFGFPFFYFSSSSSLSSGIILQLDMLHDSRKYIDLYLTCLKRSCLLLFFFFLFSDRLVQ